MTRPSVSRLAACALILALSAVAVPPRAIRAEDAPKVKYVRGRITDVNAPGNRISIEWLYGAFNPAQKELTFYYTDRVEVLTDRRPIFSRVRPIGIVDLIISDHVVITYYEDPASNRLIATKIRVLSNDIPRAP